MARGEYGLSSDSSASNGVPSPDRLQVPQNPWENGAGALPVQPPANGENPWRERFQRLEQRLEQRERRPWTDAQRQALVRSAGLSAIGSVAGAVLWKDHRIWGFILGGMAGGGLGRLIFAPRDPWADFADELSELNQRSASDTAMQPGYTQQPG